jgi:hypothetical protein
MEFRLRSTSKRRRNTVNLGEKRRRLGIRSRTLVAGMAAIALIAGASGCSTTQQEQPNIIAKAQGAQNPVPLFSGFLGDYSHLQPGGPGQALYRYINPNVTWSQYNAIMIEPVTFWGGEDSSVSAKDQELLCTYFYNKMRQDLVKYFSVVNEAGPGVMKLQVAITDASAATPVLRTASVVIPQARLLNKMTELATGSFAFVGSARGEMKLTDSVSGTILAEALDQRLGGNSIQTAATWQWGDSERVIDQWCELMATKLNQLHTTGTLEASAS